MDQTNIGAGPLSDFELLTGGTQNVLVRFSRSSVSYVLRRGPEFLRPGSNEAIRREMRVLAALAETEVPHPRLVAACGDESVLGDAVFYLMEPINGVNPSVMLAPVQAKSADVRHKMGLHAVEALTKLGEVDHERVGLGDFGHPDGFLERQVPRWMAELEGYHRISGYPGQSIPDLEVVAKWLEANRPPSFLPGMMHGDYHLANLLYCWEGPELAAIVDWEMCTVGDPLLDLGWLLATWTGRHQVDVGGALIKAGGLPTKAELIAHYGERSVRDLSAIAWYEVLACFKLGILLEGTYARACAGDAPREVGDRLHATTLVLFQRAHQSIAGT